MRHQEFRRLLAREAGNAADASAIAVAACRLFEHFARQLTPIIGDSGVAAVYTRGLYVARQQLPWLPPAFSAKAEGSFVSVQISLQQQEASVATEATLILLTTISELLSSFIGEGLTSHLLLGAWPDDSTGDTTRKTTT